MKIVVKLKKIKKQKYHTNKRDKLCTTGFISLKLLMSKKQNIFLKVMQSVVGTRGTI